MVSQLVPWPQYCTMQARFQLKRSLYSLTNLLIIHYVYKRHPRIDILAFRKCISSFGAITNYVISNTALLLDSITLSMEENMETSSRSTLEMPLRAKSGLMQTATVQELTTHKWIVDSFQKFMRTRSAPCFRRWSLMTSSAQFQAGLKLFRNSPKTLLSNYRPLSSSWARSG